MNTFDLKSYVFFLHLNKMVMSAGCSLLVGVVGGEAAAMSEGKLTVALSSLGWRAMNSTISIRDLSILSRADLPHHLVTDHLVIVIDPCLTSWE